MTNPQLVFIYLPRYNKPFTLGYGIAQNKQQHYSTSKSIQIKTRTIIIVKIKIFNNVTSCFTERQGMYDIGEEIKRTKLKSMYLV